MPDYLMIEFPDYKGNNSINDQKIIPISPIEHKFKI